MKNRLDYEIAAVATEPQPAKPEAASVRTMLSGYVRVYNTDLLQSTGVSHYIRMYGCLDDALHDLTVYAVSSNPSITKVTWIPAYGPELVIYEQVLQ